ncbi:antibiotic biosynthesis monooxygenase family protein [Streptomyces sp. NPDC014983]|uniref:antibiotic biosynthesis monooxygenase family protein n=1 Tax=unclassified Streptomyces TaxID=2593676 RepID=UPI003326065C
MVVFVNKLHLHGRPEELEAIYARVAAHFAAQPGFIGYRLVRSTDDPAVYFNIAEWQDEAAFRAATAKEEFRSAVRVGKVSTGDPHLCAVVADHAG